MTFSAMIILNHKAHEDREEFLNIRKYYLFIVFRGFHFTI
jgi:hypothetical protein